MRVIRRSSQLLYINNRNNVKAINTILFYDDLENFSEYIGDYSFLQVGY